MKQEITIFKNIKDTDTPFYRNVYKVLERIKDGKSKELVTSIRREKNKAERNELKKQLPSICFSGKFSKREDNSLIHHSGLICLDFDGYSKQKDLIQHKEKLIKDKYTFCVFISPSGNGLKVLVRIPNDAENHVNYFKSLENYYNSPHFDKTCKNISRVCYESFDPLIYINEDSRLWEKIEEPEYREVSINIDSPTIPITDENKIVDILVKWWTKKYPMIEGQRNHNVYVLAMAFNDYGINKNLAQYVCNQYATRDFNEQEISTTINSAYQNTIKFNTKYYEDEEAITEIKQQLKRGINKNEIKKQLLRADLEEVVIDSVLQRADDENKQMKFWTKTDKGVVKIIHLIFKEFLEDNGFYKYCPEGSKNYVFVRVTNNLIDHTSEKEIKDFILEYLKPQEDLSVYNYFADQTRFFREEFLTLLGTIDILFIEDTKETSYLYYNNCAVRITKDEVKTIDYLDLGGYVWKDHVIDRNFNYEDSKPCDYSRFIENICNKEESRVTSMRSTIGFLMHGHKNLSYCPAVILNDEVISDNPEGGTGKGIFKNALSKMKKLVTIDGKSFTFEKSFAYQLVSADTQILCFDDVKKYFDFERLFSVVTEGLTLEKKNKDAILIPFSRSPKIVITTNYALKGAGNSFARRKWELELFQHYKKNWTPQDEFGKLLFDDWDTEEWTHFDNYMISCLQLFLDKGLVESTFVNLKIRQLSAETCHDFIEWCGLIKDTLSNRHLNAEGKIYKQELYQDFVHEYPDYSPRARYSVSRTRFYKWLVAYCLFKYNIPPEEGRDSAGRWMIIKRPITQEEIPF
tara:strand:+ start:1768 stop:4176 length:2409 start_codon:yes stop_codon:yes gene_type:complete